MSHGIVSEDIVTIWLFFSDFDLSMNATVLCTRIEEFEKGWEDHFGSDEGDMQVSFIMLAYYSSLTESPMDFEAMEFPLSTLIPAALEWEYIYFNDEGSNWIKEDLSLQASRKRRDILRELFGTTGETLPPERIEEIVRDLGWRRKYLRYFLSRQLEAEGSPVTAIDGYNLFALG